MTQNQQLAGNADAAKRRQNGSIAARKRQKTMTWMISNRADPMARDIADRHYNRQKPGTLQFVPPGRCLVLKTAGAVWVTSWPFAEYVKHEWAGAWVNSAFRRESGPVASDLIRQALAATRWYWPEPPGVPSAIGDICMVTFIDTGKVKRKRDFGRCYRRAGFREIGWTKGGLLALGIQSQDMPAPESPICELGFALAG